MQYSIFISHGSHDRWLAKPMARQISDVGGSPFIDVFEIKKGDRIEDRVQKGLQGATELVALLTPWSVDRNWVWAEMSAAWTLRKRFVGVLYGLTIAQIEKDHGGLAMLASTNILAIDEFDDYISELKERVDMAGQT